MPLKPTFDYAAIPAEVVSKLNEFAGFTYSTLQGLQHTYLITEHVVQQGIAGDIVECGVAEGGMICVMAEALRRNNDEGRNIHLFDSFCGIPMAGVNDQDQPGIPGGVFLMDQKLPIEERLVSSGISSCSMDRVVERLRFYDFANRFSFHPGWFQRSLPGTKIGDIALLRLDGDLYESTQVCLKYLWGNVVKGGIILIDDYPLKGSRKALEEFYADRKIPLHVEVTCDTGAGFIVKE